MPIKPLSSSFVASLAALLTISQMLPLHAAAPLVFNTTPPRNDLQGTLAAEVQFAQSQIIPAHPREGDEQPHLIGLRKSLLLVRPLKPDDVAPMTLTVRDAQGKTLGTLELKAPKLLPKTAFHMDDVPEGGIDFTPSPGSSTTLRSELGNLSDKKGAFLTDLLKKNAVVDIQTADGRWVRDIYLPVESALDGKIVRVKSQAGYGSTIHFRERTVPLSRGQSLQFKCLGGRWYQDGELDNNAIVYAEHIWSGELPAEWIAPGLVLELRQGGTRGTLSDVKVGAPTQLLIHTIDVGMLTTPRGEFAFAKDPEAHREYFQTVPTSRLIVAQYAPLTLTEVMMPDGTLLKDTDPSEGGWHTGNMRQSIGKELISHGIDNANYGLHSTPGQGEKSHPYTAAQLAAHTNRGKYANGIKVHGGSGGGGIVTLDSTLGNEFSHEVGHNYGLGHYVGGFKGSVHRSAGNINSTWGWDADKKRFIPNFYPTRSGKETSLEDQTQPPFDGRSFGKDAMVGGSPFSSFNRFTLYTPYVAAIIQRFLEGKAIFDAVSPTGFCQWNASTARMEPYRHRLDVSRETTAPVEDLGAEKLTALLAGHDVVKITMGDGNWNKEIHLPPAAAANQGRTVSLEHSAGYNSTLHINDEQVTLSRGFKKSYTSDGKTWREGESAQPGLTRKPRAFGVPVVTLIGYYDPAGEKPSYIYPALHGAYGFCYADDSSSMTGTDAQLMIETASGSVLRFRLSSAPLTGQRLKGPVMHKFHVNVPEASQPRSVSVISGGKVLVKKAITPVAEKLSFTVHGFTVRSAAPAATRGNR